MTANDFHRRLKIKCFDIKARHIFWSCLLSTFGYFSAILADTIEISDDGTGDALWNAVLAVTPGDTLIVGPGNYFGFKIPDGMQNLTIIGAGPENSRIGGAPYTSIVCRESSGITIEGFKIDPNTDIIGTAGVVVNNCGITLRRNVISGYRSIWCFGESVVIAHFNSFQFIWSAIELQGMPNDVDARFNWWSSADEAVILGSIVDGRTQPDLGIIEFTSWLIAPEDISTVVEGISWGYLKNIDR